MIRVGPPNRTATNSGVVARGIRAEGEQWLLAGVLELDVPDRLMPGVLNVDSPMARVLALPGYSGVAASLARPGR